MDITKDMRSLLEKLDALELTEGERMAFGHLLGAEEATEVEGFGFMDATWAKQVQGFNLGVVLERNLTLGRRAVPDVVDHKADD